MDWQHITRTDPYLAGTIAARGHDWWEPVTAESQADSVGLTGERRADFLRGWNDALAEDEQERAKERISEREKMLDDAEREATKKGDPAW